MSFVPAPQVADCSNEHCNCLGPCTGYRTRSNCPPLIVLAVLVVNETAISDVTSAKEVRQ
jgi:predicted metal-binding protein